MKIDKVINIKGKLTKANCDDYIPAELRVHGKCIQIDNSVKSITGYWIMNSKVGEFKLLMNGVSFHKNKN